MQAWMRSWTGPGIFVGGLWLAMLQAAFYYVLHFGSPDPFGDEWDLMPGATYQVPYLPWLWAQHNEHRLPLPKLAYTALLNVSGFDTRAGGIATVAVLGTLALAFVAAARRLRGYTEYADAFFPIAFLNWGHFENYLIGFQISFAMSAGLVCVWLLAALFWYQHHERAGLKWMGVALVLLPLCGAHGLVYAPALGVASIWLARSAQRFVRVYVVACAVTAWLLCAAYFRNYLSPEHHPHSAGLIDSLQISLEVLALGWGWVGQMIWPFSGVLVAALVLVTGITVAANMKNAQESDLCIAFFAVALSCILLAIGIGWGRSGFGPLAGFAVRYGILMLPLMAVCYLAWVRLGGRLTASLVPMAFFTVSCLFLTQHCRTGLSEGRQYSEQMRAFAMDLQAGRSAEEMSLRHGKLYPDSSVFAQRLQCLRAAGIPRYSAPKMAAMR